MMTSPNPGQEKKEKKKKEYDQKHFLPVTIRQVMGCTTEPPTIDGTEIYYVKIVGCIKVRTSSPLRLTMRSRMALASLMLRSG